MLAKNEYYVIYSAIAVNGDYEIVEKGDIIFITKDKNKLLENFRFWKDENTEENEDLDKDFWNDIEEYIRNYYYIVIQNTCYAYYPKKYDDFDDFVVQIIIDIEEINEL